MPKAKVAKIFKVKKTVINENPDNFVVRYKNLSKQQVKDLRQDLDEFCQAWLKQE